MNYSKDIERSIIEIALDYGFETQSGFAKAFRKAFGYSPTQYAARMEGGQRICLR
ncbi:helix-turn-helix domain-containing protein [Paenibacillus graminis]|uniref:helix-turn-helix domain-containing protein n=1 Tax=Paenibacillus graminis TaxID=189425 RepID=UPI0004B9BAD2|nr:helix-turn-helix domain-containing protein [Paenibacillus graminis]